MKLKPYFLAFLCLLPAFQAIASEPDSTKTEAELADEALYRAYEAFADSLEQTFQYKTGRVTIGNDLAIIDVPAGFKFLDGATSETILTEVYGNPPSEEGYESLGMLLPARYSPMDDSSYVIDITFYDEGYIDDSDAKKLDFDELLETMQQDTRDANPERIEMGYPPFELIGWASPPFYDAEHKKLHWAKELRFGANDEAHVLNYNIRILGRRGYLQLNVIGEMYHLNQVKREIGPILESVNFLSGHTYKDFDPKLDQVAAYGIGGLIAGKMLLKAGLLAKLGLILAKSWKLILIALVGGGALVRKFLGKREKGEGQV